MGGNAACHPNRPFPHWTCSRQVGGSCGGGLAEQPPPRWVADVPRWWRRQDARLASVETSVTTPVATGGWRCVNRPTGAAAARAPAIATISGVTVTDVTATGVTVAGVTAATVTAATVTAADITAAAVPLPGDSGGGSSAGSRAVDGGGGDRNRAAGGDEGVKRDRRERQPHVPRWRMVATRAGCGGRRRRRRGRRGRPPQPEVLNVKAEPGKDVVVPRLPRRRRDRGGC